MDVAYLLLKAHLVLALLSLTIYSVRGILMLINSPAVAGLMALSSASVTTGLLLLTGALLAWLGGHGWDHFVLSKLLGASLYVLFGLVALKPGLNKPVAIGLWIAGLTAFIYLFLGSLRWWVTL